VIAQRGASVIEGSDNSRAGLERAASIMLADHPLGVGANNFVVAANTEGYYPRAGVVWGDFASDVHNLYWLTVAEDGYFGLVACVIFLLAPLSVALRCGVRHRPFPASGSSRESFARVGVKAVDDPRRGKMALENRVEAGPVERASSTMPSDIQGDLLIGLGVALLLVYLQNFYEWIFLTYRVQYVFVMDVGLIAGLAVQMGYWRYPRPSVQSLQGIRSAHPRRAPSQRI
jgi:hypothetical protein